MNLERKKLEALYLSGEREIPWERGSEPPPPPQKIHSSDNQALLNQVRADIGDCTRCRLCEQRTHIVFGVGNPHAQLMFVGEGPGRDEDIKGEPFVGRAGQLLTKIIEAMKMKREDVYIANVVKCLRYNAMVQLGDGSWERIGRLVRKKYDGTVMSVDGEGRLIPRKVIGWHATPLGNRTVFKLTFRSAKNAGLSKCAIYLTGDHPVLTTRGYIPVEDLRPEDRIATGQGLSPVLFNLIYGSLLGDGHISKQNAYFSFSHSQKQEEYALFKADILQRELGAVVQKFAVAAGGEELYPIVKVSTHAHRSLRTIHHLFYRPKKRVPLELPFHLNPMMLAFWFMDDGYLRIRPPRKPSAEIATCAFSDEDLEILLKGLHQLGIQAHKLRGRIHFNVFATKKLSEIIAPYVPSSMRYKLHPEIEPLIPFNPTLFEKTDRLTQWDYVEANPITFKGTDKTFYCIDVEETNNFVTTGGVVHNCRPPENRNPAPDEIETCQPFLVRQIEIIRPKVIVCLGNHAVQTLLQTENKITGLRGRFHPWPGPILKERLGTELPENSILVMPTYHPAFLLRNPNMKRPVWEDMQKVMEELKKSPQPILD